MSTTKSQQSATRYTYQTTKNAIQAVIDSSESARQETLIGNLHAAERWLTDYARPDYAYAVELAADRESLGEYAERIASQLTIAETSLADAENALNATKAEQDAKAAVDPEQAALAKENALEAVTSLMEITGSLRGAAMDRLYCESEAVTLKEIGLRRLCEAQAATDAAKAVCDGRTGRYLVEVLADSEKKYHEALNALEMARFEYEVRRAAKAAKARKVSSVKNGVKKTLAVAVLAVAAFFMPSGVSANDSTAVVATEATSGVADEAPAKVVKTRKNAKTINPEEIARRQAVKEAKAEITAKIKTLQEQKKTLAAEKKALNEQKKALTAKSRDLTAQTRELTARGKELTAEIKALREQKKNLKN